MQIATRREFNQPAHTQPRDSQLCAPTASKAEDLTMLVRCFPWPSKNSLSRSAIVDVRGLKHMKQGCGNFSSLIELLYRSSDFHPGPPLGWEMGRRHELYNGGDFFFFLFSFSLFLSLLLSGKLVFDSNSQTYQLTMHNFNRALARTRIML